MKLMVDKFKILKHHFEVWKHMTKNSFVMVLSQKIAFWFFLLGKIIRFTLFMVFLVLLLRGTKSLAGYNIHETIFFFLTFNLVDVVSQFLFRESYRFRPKIVTGDFDLSLAKPINPLFSSLMGGADILDFLTIPPLALAVVYTGNLLSPDWSQVILFIVLFINSIIIATAFHICVLAFGIVTFEIDNILMLYRETTSLGRFPVDIYKEPLKSFLTFLLPVGIMMTFPGKALMGLLNIQSVVVSIFIGALFVFLALKYWNYALTKYQSASS